MVGKHILVVDDDPVMIKLLRANLKARGYKVIIAEDGAEALQAFEESWPRLVILDIMMPKRDGRDVCRRIRERAQIPIIMLTALGDIQSKVECFKLGADDYITKPFAIDELMARISTVLRRSQLANNVSAKSSYTYGDLKIDFVQRLVTSKGKEIRLTPLEYNLLRALVLNADKVLTHYYLLSTIWGPEYEREKEYLREYIHHLRAKLEPDPSIPRYITTVPGVGYQFRSAA